MDEMRHSVDDKLPNSYLYLMSRNFLKGTKSLSPHYQVDILLKNRHGSVVELKINGKFQI